MVLFLLSFFFFPVALADDCIENYNVIGRLDNKKCEPRAPISGGSGIVSPSNLAAIGENPVGYAFNQSFKFHASLLKPAWGSKTTLGLAMAGGGNNLGAGMSIQDGLTSMGAAALSRKAGVGFSFRPSSSSRYVDSRYPVMRSRNTIGTLLNPKGRASIGFIIHDIFQSDGMYGVGISTKLSSKVSFILDNTYRPGSRDGLIKPGFGFQFRQFMFSFAGNIPIYSARADWSHDIVTAALSFWSSEHYKFVAYYNRNEVYYAGLTVNIK